LGSWVPILHNDAWAAVYLPAKWHLDPSSHLATIYMARKLGALLFPFLGEGTGSPSNTMWPGPRPTSVLSGILMHPTVWPQYTGRKLGGVLMCPPPFGGGEVGPQHNVAWAEAYLRTKWHLDPTTRLATTDMGQNWRLCPLLGRTAGSSSKTMWPSPRPTSMPSFISIHPTPVGDNTPTLQTGQDRQTDTQTDRQTDRHDRTTVR